MTGTDILFVIALGILALLAWFFVPAWMIKRNIPKVIGIFREKHAIGIQNAKTVEELGLKQKAILERMLSRRDWKPKALDLLIQTQIVLITEDGKLYITEESLDRAAMLIR